MCSSDLLKKVNGNLHFNWSQSAGLYWMLVAGCLPAALQFIMMFKLPESPHWQVIPFFLFFLFLFLNSFGLNQPFSFYPHDVSWWVKRSILRMFRLGYQWNSYFVIHFTYLSKLQKLNWYLKHYVASGIITCLDIISLMHAHTHTKE